MISSSPLFSSPLPPARLPPPVRPGARVGVAALSGPVKPERLAAGVAALGALGFEVVEAANLGRAEGYLAGSDAERLAAFHRLAADPSLEAIFFARGGYGVMRLLPGIDWSLLARHPRAYVGYSDLTPFLLSVVARLGLAAFQGPMVAADFARALLPEEQRSLLAALAGEPQPPMPARGWVGEGEAEGVLLGGCLSMLAACVGTPLAVPLGGSLLLLEDTQEPLYRLDRLLTQLELSGALAGVQGFALGRFDPHKDLDPRLLALWADRLGGREGRPIAVGLSFGHTAPNCTLPLGLPARLVPGSGLEVVVS